MWSELISFAFSFSSCTPSSPHSFLFWHCIYASKICTVTSIGFVTLFQ
jgi:hypothetical protein